MASKAVFNPSPTSLCGGSGNLLMTRTMLPLRAKRLFENVLRRDVGGSPPRAFHFDSVVKYGAHEHHPQWRNHGGEWRL